MGHNTSFLWGPPGTGKTHTIGRMVAAHLAGSQERVLLLSSTNVAVDQAIVSVGEGIDELRVEATNIDATGLEPGLSPTNSKGRTND
ncbi:MAG: AAA family ATPase [Acidobacteriaceae bacterium]|nr:AAA family ATPase [Acidobacteriaceae bacterium]